MILKIGRDRYEVISANRREIQGDGDITGLKTTTLKKRRIRIYKRLNRWHAVDVLIHELVHKALDGVGIDDELEEVIAAKVARCLTAVLRGNADLDIRLPDWPRGL